MGHKIDAVIMKGEDGFVRRVDVTIDDRTFEMDRTDLWRLESVIENSFKETWVLKTPSKQTHAVKQLSKTV